MKRILWIVGIFFCWHSVCAINAFDNQKMWINQPSRLRKGFNAIGRAAEDILLLNLYLFSVTSAKILTAFTPFYLPTRMIDETIQCHFYDKRTHTNIYQLPQSCHAIAQKAVGAPMVFLSSMALWVPDKEIRTTARMFALGVPFVHWGKNIIKTLDTNICLRPWNEHFSKEKRSTGGFPSGHMANVTYMTALWGMRHGYKWAIPLGLFSAFVFADFINCNRHYASQLIAGIGFGLLYAFSADAVIKRRKKLNMNMQLGYHPQGQLTASMSWQF